MKFDAQKLVQAFLAGTPRDNNVRPPVPRGNPRPTYQAGMPRDNMGMPAPRGPKMPMPAPQMPPRDNLNLAAMQPRGPMKPQPRQFLQSPMPRFSGVSPTQRDIQMNLMNTANMLPRKKSGGSFY